MFPPYLRVEKKNISLYPAPFSEGSCHVLMTEGWETSGSSKLFPELGLGPFPVIPPFPALRRMSPALMPEQIDDLHRKAPLRRFLVDFPDCLCHDFSCVLASEDAGYVKCI